ncbi:hypothetical protein H2201_001440 [Coniosporium apollinis]|uniref:Uncharacterized protein n=1 Tax=Coniosporium apollinis TaxID=61459 RepID=A0ABQ9P7P4_9PEZI|nr:hypothetical protein H2201_001440 [Coniosporium apollinis]
MGGPLVDIGSNQQRLPRKTVQRNSFMQLQDENSIPTPKKTPEQDPPHYMASTKTSINAQATPSRSKLPRRAVTPSSFSSTAAKGRAWVALATKRVHSGRGKTPDHSNGTLSAVAAARIAKGGVPSLSSPLDKRLPSLPIAQVSTSSPVKESRTLLDAAERPLRKSPGTPEEAEWPALSPERTSTSSGTAKSSSAEHSVQDLEVSHAVEAQFVDKPTAVMVRKSVTDPATTHEDATTTSHEANEGPPCIPEQPAHRANKAPVITGDTYAGGGSQQPFSRPSASDHQDSSAFNQTAKDADGIIYGDHPPPPPPKPRSQTNGYIKRDSSNITGLRKASERNQKEPCDHGVISSSNIGEDEDDAVSYKLTLFESPKPKDPSTEGAKASLHDSTGASTSQQRFVNRTNFNRPLLLSEEIQSIGFPSRVSSQASHATKITAPPHTSSRTLKAPSLMNAKPSADLSPYSSVGDYLKQAESIKSSNNSMPRSDSKARLALSGIRSIFHKRDPKSVLKEKDPNQRMTNATSYGTSAKTPKQSSYINQPSKTSQAPPITATPTVPSARLFVRPRHPSEYISESPSLESPAQTASSETTRLATALIEQARSKRLDASEQAHLLNLGEIMLHTANFHARSRQAMERAQQAAREAKLAHDMTQEAMAAIVRIVHRSTSVSDLLARR